MTKLIYNEQLKLWKKKRILVIILIIACLVPIFTYAQYKESKSLQEKMGTSDWRVQLQKQIVDTQNRLGSASLSDDFKKYLRITLSQEQYYLNHNINPNAPGAPTFMRVFIENAIGLLLPLFVMVAASDIVSSETSRGTIKLLLTRPVKRWKILLSKYIAMLLSVSFILLCTAVLTYAISGIVFGYSGWNLPMLTGFTTKGNELLTTHVHSVPQWSYLLMELGLAWFVCVVAGSLTFMLSVLLRSTAAVMGIMLSSLIAGAILTNMVSAWPSAKYLFMVNLQLTNYVNGSSPPVEGMTLGFSIAVLSVWLVFSLIVSFVVFMKRDVY
ncbi:ABC transporter permease [Weizmannia acidilactici]|uniref:ABC transporter permease n=1 Tax=Weizmannia acidilactici TaxID=2607726 RepID=A0A5J4JET4_9BACI|nr:ABC transporter permease [Weizmannia acidilactici]GER65877.1 ABC transporter permease [Weizmannia acidilactici]GER69939.1 ABC transporter permease [Weizmannia acidilactici]GER73128.1 ABC transporter permease [Weizmannia acidilactici]